MNFDLYVYLISTERLALLPRCLGTGVFALGVMVFIVLGHLQSVVGLDGLA